MKAFKEHKYSLEDDLQKSWSESFQIVYPRETMMKSFFSEVTAWYFTEKELHYSYFPMTLTRFSEKSCFVEHLWLAVFEEIKSHT